MGFEVVQLFSYPFDINGGGFWCYWMGRMCYGGNCALCLNPNLTTSFKITYNCPYCNQLVELGDIYCKHCGKRLQKQYCPTCGKELDET